MTPVAEESKEWWQYLNGMHSEERVCSLAARNCLRKAALLDYSTRWGSDDITADRQNLICLIYRGCCREGECRLLKLIFDPPWADCL